MKNEYDLIVTIINRGYADYVIDAAREAGASGGTIIFARGSYGNNETDKFLGVSIQPEKEAVLTLVKHEEKNKIMKYISEKSNLDEKGHGICFSLPASKVVGISKINEQKVEEKTTTSEKTNNESDK